MRREPTLRQLQIAQALAENHGHIWAKVQLREGITLGEIVAEADLLTRTAEDMPGGVVPQLDEQGHIVHATQTGRLRWSIGPNGSIEIGVYRPSVLERAYRATKNESPADFRPAVDEAHAQAMAQDPEAFKPELVLRYHLPSIDENEATVEHFGPCHIRHVEALFVALDALHRRFPLESPRWPQAIARLIKTRNRLIEEAHTEADRYAATPAG